MSEDGGEEHEVLIKTVKKGASSRQRQDFLTEVGRITYVFLASLFTACRLKGLSFHEIPAHPNLAQVIASGLLFETHSDPAQGWR